MTFASPPLLVCVYFSTKASIHPSIPLPASSRFPSPVVLHPVAHSPFRGHAARDAAQSPTRAASTIAPTCRDSARPLLKHPLFLLSSHGVPSGCHPCVCSSLPRPLLSPTLPRPYRSWPRARTLRRHQPGKQVQDPSLRAAGALSRASAVKLLRSFQSRPRVCFYSSLCAACLCRTSEYMLHPKNKKFTR